MEEHSSKTSWKNRLACVLIAVAVALGSLSPAGTAASQAGEPAAPTVVLYFPLFSHYDPNAVTRQVVVRNWPAFDACHLPALSTLETWWNKSPYWTVNLYLGGSAFSTGCKYDGLNSAWLAAADKIGWTFIPTWVGPQAPCSNYKSRISADQAAAFQQGRGEADLAVQRARGLGFQNDLVIYLDIEAYAYYNDSGNACRDATNAYVSGWVARLHELGHTAGAYGSSCGSLITSWSAIANVPDVIWAAYWTQDGYVSNLPLNNILCLSDSLWTSHQRIRQYAGDHNETWGGATLNIDSDITDGAVQAYGPGGLAAKPPAAAAVTIQSSGPQLEDFQLVAPGQGWALAGNRLLWTGEAGTTWQDITPAETGSAPLLDAFFLTGRQGWLAAQSPTGGLRVLRTVDGGATWLSASLPAGTAGTFSPVDEVFLEFIDAQTGWAAVKLQSGGPFSQGVLYRTVDGGATWSLLPLPLGEPVRFADALRGWVAGGAAGDQLFATQDGGATWQELSPVPAEGPGQVFYGLPVFTADGAALLPVTRTGIAEASLEIYALSSQPGAWKLAAAARLDPAASPGSALSLSPAGTGRWWAVLPDGSVLSIENASGGLAVDHLRPAGFRAGVTRLQFAGPTSGWAQFWSGTCSGEKASDAFSCAQQTGLSQTADAGQSWSELTLAGPAY